ncbi:MAG: hypothetical protein P4L45_07250, partial [Ignavibacteriaceae bacterium]|nr:hypothetical protein [Ignavibacteriaceae bacterium]
MSKIKSYYRNLLMLTALTVLSIVINAYPGEKKDTVKTIDFDSALKTSLGDLTVARVGNKKISAREFLSSYEFGPSFTKREKDSKKRYLNYMINEKLLALDGLGRGYADSSQVKELLSAIKSDISTEMMFEDDIWKNITIKQPELNKGVTEKEIIYRVKWLYAPDSDSLNFYTEALKRGISFDSLFNEQLKDSIFADKRSMDKDKFQFRIENPEMYSIVAPMKAGEVSKPVKGPDGWYIVELVNSWKNIITSETQRQQEAYDVNRALTMAESDSLSDVYVRKMMLESNPVIQAKTFDILRSYLGKYVLNSDKFNSWKLDERMQKALKNFESLKPLDYNNLKLVVLNTQSFTLSDFLNWYKMRDEYIKFNETNFNTFSASLEQWIWQMVRDNLLTGQAYARGYQDKEFIK